MASEISNKNIVLGITGSIAAYKAAILARLLVKAGANVRVVMTESAKQFITALTMQSITGHAVRSDIFDADAELTTDLGSNNYSTMGHIELARWADYILIAPASANTIAKLSAGIADDLLTTLCLAADESTRIILAPAMNKIMWQNALVQRNIGLLTDLVNYSVINPDSGEQACGDIGAGRMAEPEYIVEYIEKSNILALDKAETSRQILITAGPTLEPIDPVRYISNHSSGKMGYSIAKAANQRGHEVTLISGPVSETLKHSLNKNIKLIQVSTAKQMLEQVNKYISKQDIFIGVAAVADYRCMEIQDHKIKKDEQTLDLKLEKNPDILKQVTKYKQKFNKKLKVIGFAAETKNFINNARSKLLSKNLDLIVLNDVGNSEIAFNSDYNEVKLLDNNDNLYKFKKQAKSELAVKLMRVFEAISSPAETKNNIYKIVNE